MTQGEAQCNGKQGNGSRGVINTIRGFTETNTQDQKVDTGFSNGAAMGEIAGAGGLALVKPVFEVRDTVIPVLCPPCPLRGPGIVSPQPGGR